MRRTVDRNALSDAQSDRAARSAATVDAGEARVIVPRVARLRDGFLEWSNEQPGWDHRWEPEDMAEEGVLPFTLGERTDALLTRFMRLYRGPDEGVVSFARSYGVLYLSPSGNPNGLPDVMEYAEETLIDVVPGDQMTGKGTGRERPVRWYRESLAGWRAWSVFVRTLVLLCLEARKATTRIDPHRMTRVWGPDSYTPKDEEAGAYVASQYRAMLEQLSADHSIELQRVNLGDWLDFLMAHAAAVLRISWSGTDRLAMRVHAPRSQDFALRGNWPTPVFSDVIVQLLNTLLGDANIHFCPKCGDPYEIEERRRGFCPTCRPERRRASKRATWHKNKDRYNQRRRERSSAGSDPL